MKHIPVHKFFHYCSYAQDGEDMIIRSLYEHLKGYKGYYVDVGAHHPYRFSNTKYFYSKGWRGINIEPSPKALRLFRIFRSRDISLNIGVSDSPQELTYYCFNEPALNGFSKELSEYRNSAHARYHLIKTIVVKTLPLAQILDQYLPKGQKIDFLTIDAEGFDLIVLQSNDWTLYRPAFVLVEDAVDFLQLRDSAIYQLMAKVGYSLVAKTVRTLVFQDKA
ncbi:FkbM family methyltransferase [Sphingobacterium deserti]|uniref:FkbM family methyltransferase n=1 Tax=Sphingobacterium deserti TaxID=1229276 RepID=UPI0019D3FB8D|nr:FkbM family methyltransferase [Sphingobacterium deserti]